MRCPKRVWRTDSKGAIASLTRATALDLAEIGVRVNTIAPIAATRLTLAAQVGFRHVPEGASRAPLEGIEDRTPDRVAPLPLLVQLLRHVAHVVVRAVAVHAHRLTLDQGGTSSGPRQIDRRARGLEDVLDVVAVDVHARESVRMGALDRVHRELELVRRRVREPVVL